jgi:hypothetical protein
MGKHTLVLDSIGPPDPEPRGMPSLRTLPPYLGIIRSRTGSGRNVCCRSWSPIWAGPHTETPLHWAASSDDVPVLDALLDAGGDIECPGRAARSRSA